MAAIRPKAFSDLKILRLCESIAAFGSGYRSFSGYTGKLVVDLISDSATMELTS